MEQLLIYFVIGENYGLLEDGITAIINGKWFDDTATEFYDPCPLVHNVTKREYIRFDDQYSCLYKWNPKINAYSSE